MCRFLLYLGPPITLASLITEPAHSLIRQSVHARERDEPLNGDGFGVAWYDFELSSEPGRFRSVTPAWSNQNLVDLARMTRSRCILAHVRAATQGLGVAEANCHPFTDGPYAFMHNGDLGGFHRFKRLLRRELSDAAYDAVRGTTDSEHLFALALDRLRATHTGDTPASSNTIADALVFAVNRALALAREAGVNEPSYINAALSNGRAAAVCRFTTDAPTEADSLYIHTGRRYVCENGVCRMINPESGANTAIISSEPLSEDPGWTPIPVNHIALINEDRSTHVRPWPAATA